MKENGELGWNDEIDPTNEGGGFVLLPEGPAYFQVTSLKRTRKTFGKFGTINVAELTLLVVSAAPDNNDEAEVRCQLGLHRDLEWKITEFFTAIKQRKHGDSGKFVPDWSDVEGRSGGCIIEHRRFAKKADKPGEKTGVSNDIAKFIPDNEVTVDGDSTDPEENLNFD